MRSLRKLSLALLAISGIFTASAALATIGRPHGEGWLLRKSGEIRYTLSFGYGRIVFAKITPLPDIWLGIGTPQWNTQTRPTFSDVALLGFHRTRTERFTRGPTTHNSLFRERSIVSTFEAPLWPITALLLFWPISAATRDFRKRSRIHAGLCPSCGYDLRATPNRCPECNWPASRNPAWSRHAES